MKERLQNAGRLNLGNEISRNDQKKILGGVGEGHRCTSMPAGQCSSAPIDWVGYCAAVWHSSAETCWLT